MTRVELILPPRMVMSRTVLVPVELQMHRTEDDALGLGSGNTVAENNRTAVGHVPPNDMSIIVSINLVVLPHEYISQT